MNRRLGTIALASGLVLAGELGFSSHTAQSQGPLRPQRISGFPLQSGEPVLPAAETEARQAPKVTQPAPVQPGGYYVRQGNAVYQAAPSATAPVRRRRFLFFGR